MNRRAFLRTTTTGIAGLSALSRMPAGVEGSTPSQTLPEGQPANDGYQAPGWLRYSRTIYFDGKTLPIFPHVRDFDAERLVKVVTRLGGDTLRFEPVSNWAYYPSKVFPVCPELGNLAQGEVSPAISSWIEAASIKRESWGQ